jgi:hypothetical protein
MKKKYYSHLSFIIISAIIIVLTSCGNNKEEQDESDSSKAGAVKPFSVANYNFAILENKKFINYNKAIYHRGDEVFLVLENVGPFHLGPDSLNRAEMKLKVTDAIGQVITERDSLFGERGHSRFTNNILNSPYGSFESTAKNLPGKYTMCVTIFDMVKMDSIVVCDDFFIE